MLTRNDLLELYKKHRNDRVLSIYLDADEHDPAKRRAWRRTLDHILEDARATAERAGEIEAFDKAEALLKKDLRQYDAFLPDRGWAGFATVDRLLYAETLPVPMPDLACWEDGLRAAPYVRALKQAVPVITVLVDSRQAKLYEYRQGTFNAVDAVRADTFFGDLSDTNQSKRATTHSGIRGITETDAAQRFEEVGMERLFKRLAETIPEQAGPDGTVLVGGPAEATAQLVQRLRKQMNGRVLEDSSLAFHMSAAELKKATEEAASKATLSRQDSLLGQVADLAASGGRGALGREATQQALQERRVEVLLLSRQFAYSQPEFADHCVGAALEQDADVEELGGDAAVRLDREGNGIAARLRFTT